MNRKRLRKLEVEFARRGGGFWIAPDAPPEVTRALLTELLRCPECRAVVLEACNGPDREDVDIDAVLGSLAMREH